VPTLEITDWSQVPVMVPINVAARAIGVSRSSLYNVINSGELRTKQVGGRRFIPKPVLMRYCEAR
jgi:excisionase family DNA binding protein